MAISYSPESADAIGFLKAHKNAIDVFVEDASKVEIWTALVQKCIPQSCKFGSVNPLGNRDDVLRACKDFKFSNRPALYIVDGDYDFMLGKSISRRKSLFVLPSTNLEAAIFSLNGISKLIGDMCPLLDGETEKRRFDKHVSQFWDRPLRRLFYHYAVHYDVGGKCVTSSHHVSRLTIKTSKLYLISNVELVKKIREIGNEILSEPQRYRLNLERVSRRCNDMPIYKIASGKTYLFPIFENYIYNKFNIKLGNDVLMKSIISRSTSVLPPLRRKIRALLK